VAPNFHHVPLPLFVRQQNEKVIETLDLGLGYSFYDYYKYALSLSFTCACARVLACC
jgi:hypothetical protein